MTDKMTDDLGICHFSTHW